MRGTGPNAETNASGFTAQMVPAGIAAHGQIVGGDGASSRSFTYDTCRGEAMKTTSEPPASSTAPASFCKSIHIASASVVSPASGVAGEQTSGPQTGNAAVLANILASRLAARSSLTSVVIVSSP